MSDKTPNGWPELKPGDPRLMTGHVPGANIGVQVRNDQLGFLALFWFAFWHEKVESLRGRSDVGCHADRPRRGAEELSEHAGAAADDCAWDKHPQGVPISHTFTAAQIKTIRQGVKWLNRVALGKVIEWGGEWPSHPGSHALTDGMHVQFYPGRVLFLVRRILVHTKRGKAVLAANPKLRIAGVKR